MRRALVVTWFMVLAVGIAGPTRQARADEDPYPGLIAQAVAEFDGGNWEEAGLLFRRAHELNPSARTWRGMGLASFEQRRYVDAVAQLEAALADPRKPLTAKQRAEVQGVLDRARQYVSAYRVTVRPPDAEVLVDGKPATLRDGVLFLDPGSHELTVRAAGYAERSANLRAAAGARDELAIQLAVAEPPEAPAPEAHPESAVVVAAPLAAPSPPQPRRRVWTWVLGGAGLGSLGAALGLGIATNNKADDFDACRRAEESDCNDLADSGRALQRGTNIALGVGGALVAGAVVAFFVEGRAPTTSDAHVALQLGPGRLGLAGRF